MTSLPTHRRRRSAPLASRTRSSRVRAIGVLPQGSHKFFGKKTGLRSSGVRGPDGLTTASYDLKFKRVSPAKGFRYACAVHGAMMSGTVIVR